MRTTCGPLPLNAASATHGCAGSTKIRSTRPTVSTGITFARKVTPPSEEAHIRPSLDPAYTVLPDCATAVRSAPTIGAYFSRRAASVSETLIAGDQTGAPGASSSEPK